MRQSVTILLGALLWIPTSLLGQKVVADSLQKIINAGNMDIETNKALNALATEYTRSDIPRAKSLLYRSIEMATTLNNTLLLSYAYSQMVTVQQNAGSRDSAEYYLSRLEKTAQGPVAATVKANFNMAAGLYYKKAGNFRAALPYMIRSLNDFIESDPSGTIQGVQINVAGQCLNIGNVYLGMGDYRKALQYHLRGLKIFDKTGNQRGVSFCYQSICGDFIHLNQFQEAKPYAEKALQLKTALNDKRGIANAMLDYGTIYRGLGDFDKALFYLQDGLQSFHEMQILPDEARAQIELGKTYLAKKDEKQAGLYFDRARGLAIQIKDSSLLNTVDMETSSSMNKAQQEKQNEKNLLSKLEESRKMGDKSQELSAIQYLATYYEDNKQFDKALNYTRALQQSRDSVQNGDLQLQVRKMEEQYNLDKKESEIALLKKGQLLDAEKIKRQHNIQQGIYIFTALLLLIGGLLINRYRVVQKAKRTIDMERMRNRIARDLHDDIGSALTSINILSKMVMQQNGPGSETGSSLRKINEYSGVIMDNMSDIVWAINPQNDTLSKIIVRIKTFAAEILDPLNISYTIREEGALTDIPLDISRRKDFYLVCKEAINNAAKYSQCSVLDITIRADETGLHLTVKDNGKGFDAGTVNNGNGLKNMQARAVSMKAGFSISSSPGKGCRIQLDIPVT